MCDSIGSLGSDDSENYVSDVVVDTATLTGTTNGVRIKTWQVIFLTFKSTFKSTNQLIFGEENKK